MMTEDSGWRILEEAERASRARDLQRISIPGRRTAAEIDAAKPSGSGRRRASIAEDLDLSGVRPGR